MAYQDLIGKITNVFEFKKQGRIEAIAHEKGAEKNELRSKTENINYLDEMFLNYNITDNNN